MNKFIVSIKEKHSSSKKSLPPS